MDVAGFVDAWTRLASAWLDLDEVDPAGAAALVERALEVGLDVVVRQLPGQQEHRDVARADAVRAEIAVIRRSGAMDEAGYLAHNPQMAASGGDPVVNYCRSGWRRMRNPSLDLDGWWYRSEHLLTADGAIDDTVNPLLHHLLVGRFTGLAPLPQARLQQPVTGDGRRAILFAAFDRDGLVDDYVVAYVRELARFGDVFVLYDGDLGPGQAARLDGLVQGLWTERHASYDFGSWARLAADLVGWDALEQYDTVLLVNDSCYLMRPLDDVFTAMDATTGQFWGLQATARMFEPEPDQPQSVSAADTRRHWLPRAAYRYEEFLHVGSYFLALRRPAFTDPGFRIRLDSARHVVAHRHQLLVAQYETGTTRYLTGRGFEFATFVAGLRGFHPIYGTGYFELLAEGFPLLKRRFLVDNPFDAPGLDRWRERVLAACPEAPIEMIQANLARVTRA